jgi:hypothetical protein
VRNRREEEGGMEKGETVETDIKGKRKRGT